MIIKTNDQTGTKYLAWVDPKSVSIMWVHNRSKAQNYNEEEGKKVLDYITNVLRVTCSVE